MELVEFFDKVEAHEKLQGINVDMEKEYLAVHFTEKDIKWNVTKSLILAKEWDYFEPRLTSKENPNPVIGMTRVVGYYSRIQNWNKSKIGELKDRQKGTYALGVDEGKK